MSAVLGVEHGKVKEEEVVIGHPQGIDDLPMMKVIIEIIREEEVMMMMITTTAAMVAGMVVDGMIYMTLQVVVNLVVAVMNMKKKRMTLVVVHVKSKTSQRK